MDVGKLGDYLKHLYFETQSQVSLGRWLTGSSKTEQEDT